MFVIFFEDVILGKSMFFLSIVLGALGLSASFTMTSAIVSKAQGGAGLLTILSFPTLIPQLIFLIKIGKLAVDGFAIGESGSSNIFALIGLDVIIISVSFILFPYLWRD
jgi:heme exporter protein B